MIHLFKASSVPFGQRQHKKIIFPTALIYIVCKIAVKWQNEWFTFVEQLSQFSELLFQIYRFKCI